MKKGMKNYFWALSCLAVTACAPTQNILTVTEKTINLDSCNLRVSIQYPSITTSREEISEEINSVIGETLGAGISIENAESNALEGVDLEEVITALLQEKCADSLLSERPFELLAKSSTFEHGNILSVYLEKCYYLGGANPENNTLFLNFDSKTGTQLDVSDLFSDTTRLSTLCKAEFLKLKGLKGTENEEETGLFLPLNRLSLPANIGFSQEGVVLIYNQYEIGPRSYGITRIVLPYAEVQAILKE